MPRSIALLVVAAVSLAASAAAQQRPRYLVTGAPLRVGQYGSPVCFAITTATGAVQWWQPGNHGCRDRSSELFRAITEARHPGSANMTRFRLPMHGALLTDSLVLVALVHRNDSLLALPAGVAAPALALMQLAIPPADSVRGRGPR